MEQTSVSVIFCGRDELPINYLETYFTGGGYALNKIHSYYSPFDDSIMSDKEIGIVYISSHFLESSKCMKHSAYLTQRIKEAQLLPVITSCTNLENVQGYMEHWNHTNFELTESGVAFLNFLKNSNCFYYKDGPTDGEKLVLKVKELKQKSVSTSTDLSKGTDEKVPISMDVHNGDETNDPAQEATVIGMAAPSEATITSALQEEKEASIERSYTDNQEEESKIKKLEKILEIEAERDPRAVEYYENLLKELNDKLNEVKVENRVASLEYEIKKVKDIQTTFLTMIEEAKKITEEHTSVEELSKVYENQKKETKRFYEIKIEKLQNLLTQKDLEIDQLKSTFQQDLKDKATALAEKIVGEKERTTLEKKTSEETRISIEEEEQRKIRRATIKGLIQEQEVANTAQEDSTEQIDNTESNPIAVEQSIKVATIHQNELLQNKIFDLFSEYEKELQEKYKKRMDGIDPTSNSGHDRDDFDKRIDPFGNGNVSNHK